MLKKLSTIRSFLTGKHNVDRGNEELRMGQRFGHTASNNQRLAGLYWGSCRLAATRCSTNPRQLWPPLIASVDATTQLPSPALAEYDPPASADQEDF
jgi:hypothetical protein